MDLLIKRSEFQNLMTNVSSICDEILVIRCFVTTQYFLIIYLQAFEDKEIEKIMLKNSEYIRKLSKAVRYTVYTFVFVANINPLIERKLLLPTSIPGMNTDTSTFFWIMYFPQIIEIYYVVKLMLPFVDTSVSFLVFGLAQLQVLNHKLSFIGVDKMSIKRELKSCTVFHLQILR